ncbi:MAG: hypothetical protein MI757_19265 [Pirellulales bacterium]|nr:hypothetical protein [Pirellulales bacterium]
MRRALLAGFLAVSAFSLGCARHCCDPYGYGYDYGYAAPVAAGPTVSSGCSTCVSTPSITTYSAPSPTLAPGQ